MTTYNPNYLTDPAAIAAALEKLGFELDAKTWPDTTGKLQLRIRRNDHEIGTNFSITPSGGEAKWELGHLHKGQNENYHVLQGSMYLAIAGTHTPSLIKLHAGQSHFVPKGFPHNAMVAPGSITLVSKIGQIVPNENGDDWWGVPEFDAHTKGISVEQAKSRAQPVR